MIRAVPSGQLLVLTLLAITCGWLGARLLQDRVGYGKLLSIGSSLVLGAVLLTIVLQSSHLRSSIDYSSADAPIEQAVVGGVTRVEMARDGHFWLAARVNGEDANFLVDTGATFTAVSVGLAERAGIERRRDAFPIELNTANGSIVAEVATIGRLEAGNIAATGLDAVVAENFGESNVIGMNFLSRLESWRVEGSTLILVPKRADTIE